MSPSFKALLWSRWPLFFAAFAILSAVPRARAQSSLVVPPGYADRFGGTHSGFTRYPVNYQTAYHSSLFTEADEAQIWITGIAFRLDQSTPSWTS